MLIDEAERQQVDRPVVQRGSRASSTFKHVGTRHPREGQRVRTVTRDVGGGECANLRALATGDL